ncbi:MAG: flagellar biosynthetic protein FliO [Desulfobacterales bacterium]|nr:flagellar biosynthetic protein FliO [Desulfobacterales bacterium]MDJ0874225.1 flagellar biosynthetic protein FliO [Desulfobacterales bacterium]MDJ0882577.1 flagellar biosynthetic protein FliO [Desulfobacterales bacterium]
MTPSPLFADSLKMIAVLVSIVAGLIFLNYYLRRQIHAGRGRSGRRISVLENAHLGVKKSIAMVQVPGAVLVLGVTADRITLLDRIDDPDGAHGAASAQPGTAPAQSFKDHLRQLTSTFKGMTPARRQDESV